MSVPSTTCNTNNQAAVAAAQAQVKTAQAAASKDAAQITSIKKAADATPTHQVTAAQAQQLYASLKDFNTQEGNLNTGLQAMGKAGDTQDVAHEADFMNQLNNSVQQTSMGLETGNDLDDALKQIGSTPGDFHDMLSQITQSNTQNLNYANGVAPNSDMDYQGAVSSANQAAMGQPTTSPSAS